MGAKKASKKRKLKKSTSQEPIAQDVSPVTVVNPADQGR